MNNLTKIIAVVLVLAAAVLASLAWWLGRRPPSTPALSTAAAASIKTAAANAGEYSVVVAVRTLEAGKPIAADALQLVKLPINPAGAYRQVSAVTGKIPTAEIGAGTPVTEAGLARGLALQLAEGERAVALPVDEVVGAGNRIEPGDYVDVFVMLKQGQDIEKTQSRLLASRLRVLSYGTAVVGAVPPAAAESGASNTQAGRPAAHTAVLATPVADVNRLVLATQSGKLLLALRHPADEKLPDVALFAPLKPILTGKAGLSRDQVATLKAPDNQAYAGVELAGLASSVASSYQHSAPTAPRTTSKATPSAAPRTVEVIRGAQRESVPF